MPHPQMSIEEMDTLETFISDIPGNMDLFLELRQEEWYKGGDGYNRELFRFLKRKKRGTVITDTAGRRDCVHMHLSVPECFIRFVGNALHHTDYERIDSWVSRIKQWMSQGLERCYFFMHQHDELHSPRLIKYLIEQLNKRCGTTLKPPQMQSTLF